MNILKKIYIFGAHSRARTLAIYLNKLYAGTAVAAFLVDNDETNPEMINGIPVIRLSLECELDISCPVYLGVRGVYHNELTIKLSGIGFEEIIPVTPMLDMKLRNDFLKVYCLENSRNFIKLEELSASKGFETIDRRIGIFVIKSAYDKELVCNNRHGNKYEVDIQVGADLTDLRISNICDNLGDNISELNGQFCELTGVYWIWKNADEDIIGLEHYRRRFILDNKWSEVFDENNVDVILPTPLYVAPSLAQNYRDRHVSEDWDYMMEMIRKYNPEDYESAKAFFDTNLYSPCNMFIMRREVLDDLCSWMFPIIFACSEHIGEREDSYQNRYPGFMSERLMSFFFEKNRDKYKVAFADKNFIA